MTNLTAHPSWVPTEDTISFEPNEINRRPRAWERNPTSPIASRHHGRKIWKRFEPPSKGQDAHIDASRASEEPLGALGDATNTPRPVKRMRLQDAPVGPMGGKENKTAQYLATLHSDALGTPKRKQARRKSLRQEPSSSNDNNVNASTPNTHEVDKSVQLDKLRASESPAPEDVRMLLGSTEHVEDTTGADPEAQSEEHVIAPIESLSPTAEVAGPIENTTPSVEDATDDNVALEAYLTCQRASEAGTQDSLAVAVDVESLVWQAEAELHPPDNIAAEIESAPVSSPIPNFSPIGPNISRRGASANTPTTEMMHAESNITHIQTVSAKKSSTQRLSEQAILAQTESPGQSPQIGTSLLRRESLRRKENPSNKRTLRKTRRETLQRRDTLQEREILRGVIAETNPEKSIDDYEDGINEPSPPHVEASFVKAIPGASEPSPCDVPEASQAAENDMEDVVPSLKETKLENKDLPRAIKAIEVYESPNKSQTHESPVAISMNDIQSSQAIDAANESIAKMEIDEATQALETDQKKMNPSNRKTRSGTRFSDETSMLKEFLNRAQAKKAAKTPVLTAPNPPTPQISPNRSPRKALGSLASNAYSPQKPRDVPNRPGTPPGKPRVDAVDSDDGEEISTEITSCRRSIRTRLPAATKGVPGAPSFIPVRRADGTDHVVLQKSQAQELAMVTRANTRRNKGQSKPPLLALQDLPVDITEAASTTASKRRAATSKTVGWAEQLASYQDATEAKELEESRPKVRKMRGPGVANSTPVAKRTTAVVNTSNGTPAPKRRGKIR